MSAPNLTLKDFAPEAIIQGWQHQEQLWNVAHWDRVRKCRDAQKGEQLWSLGETFQKKRLGQTRLRLPQTMAVPLKMVAALTAERPGIRRFAESPSPTHQSISTNVETWTDSILTTDVGGREMLDRDALAGKLLLEGAVAVIAAPSLASWERFPDFLDTIDKKKWDRLAPSRRARYSDQGDGTYARTDEDGETLPKKRYWRDARGRDEKHQYYVDNPDEKFVRDERKTEQAYEQALSAVLARRPPFNVRIVSSTDSMPVYGPGGKLIGIYVRTRYSKEHLIRRRFYWSDDDAALVKRGDEDTSGTGEVVLYEYWGYDSDGTPFVGYAVEGVDGTPCDTYFEDDEDELKPAVINLAEEHGLTRLPATWVWGMNLETDDYPNKAIPFLWPTVDALAMVEMFLSAKGAHALQHGFTSWFIEADAEIIKIMPDALLENNKPRAYDVEPMKMIVGPGKPHALVAPTTSDDVNDIIRTLLQMINATNPDNAAFGGPGATSGHDRSLAADYVDTAMGQVRRAILKVYEFVAECLLEQACSIAERFDVNVPVYAKARVSQTRILGRGTAPDQAPRILELDPDWLDGIYDVEAFWPMNPLQDIATLNLYSQLYKDGLISWEEWRAILGDESPEMSRLNLWVNQQLNTEDGKALIASLANDIMGGDLEDEIKRLVDQGLMTPDGEPIDSLVDEDELQALEYFANRRKAHWLLNGAGPSGPGAPPISPNALASTGGLLAPPAGPPMAPAAEGQFTPPGQVSGGPPPQGAPNQPRNIGTGVPNLANSALGGVVAGTAETASIRRDELARQGQ